MALAVVERALPLSLSVESGALTNMTSVGLSSTPRNATMGVCEAVAAAPAGLHVASCDAFMTVVSTSSSDLMRPWRLTALNSKAIS